MFLIISVSITENGSKKRKLSMFDQARIVSTVPSRWILNPSYMHTFGITENYFIIVEQPLAVALLTMAANQFKNEPMCSCLKWHGNENVSYIFTRNNNILIKITN